MSSRDIFISKSNQHVKGFCLSAKKRFKQFITDYEAQSIIEAESNDDADFFYINRSSGNQDLADLQTHFMACFPSQHILCGYTDNKDMKSIEYAVQCRKINLRATPYGWNNQAHCWNKSYKHLPPFMAFDCDENKENSPFQKLFPGYHGYEIHDALDIARPLVTTINPISGNCQFLYEMRWSSKDQERFRLNPQDVLNEYDMVHKELSRLLGCDLKFVNHVVRSPLYVAGHQRQYPKRPTNSNKKIELGKESLYHQSIWYDIKSYSLADLWQLIEELKQLHIQFLGNESTVQSLHVQHLKNETFQELSSSGVVMQSGECEERRRALKRRNRTESLSIDPSVVFVGERNDSLFDHIRHKAYSVAHKYKQSKDYVGLKSYLLPIAFNFVSKMPVPLIDREVTETVKSVVHWCIQHYDGFSKEIAKMCADARWLGHLSAKAEAEAEGVSERTIQRRRRKAKRQAQEQRQQEQERQRRLRCVVMQSGEYEEKKRRQHTQNISQMFEIGEPLLWGEHREAVDSVNPAAKQDECVICSKSMKDRSVGNADGAEQQLQKAAT